MNEHSIVALEYTWTHLLHYRWILYQLSHWKAQSIYEAALVSDGQQSDSVLYTFICIQLYIYSLEYTRFYYGLSWDTKHSSLCYAEETCCLFILGKKLGGFPGGSAVKNLPVNTGNPGGSGSIPLGKIRWRRKWQPTPIFLPGESRGQKSLVGYSLWGRKGVRHHWANKHLYKSFTSSLLFKKHTERLYPISDDFSFWLWLAVICFVCLC